jgi:hypothetical protein
MLPATEIAGSGSFDEEGSVLTLMGCSKMVLTINLDSDSQVSSWRISRDCSELLVMKKITALS